MTMTQDMGLSKGKKSIMKCKTSHYFLSIFAMMIFFPVTYIWGKIQDTFNLFSFFLNTDPGKKLVIFNLTIPVTCKIRHLTNMGH